MTNKRLFGILFKKDKDLNDQISTKDKIINAAIDLFSQKGYYETSVREIADLVGIHVSSLYSHFKGKEIILDLILEYYKNEINKIKLSDETLDYIIDTISPEQIMITGFRKIKEYISSEKMNKIISILLIEMYRNPKVRDFYQKWFFNENRASVMKLFKKMTDKGIINDHDPEFLSNLYNALVNSYYQELFLFKADNLDSKEIEKKFEIQLSLFLKLLKKPGGNLCSRQ